MGIVVLLTLLILGFALGSYNLRNTMPGVSQVLMGFSILLAILLMAAFLNVI